MTSHSHFLKTPAFTCKKAFFPSLVMLKPDWWFWRRLGHGSREQKQIRDQSKRERKSCENNEIGTATASELLIHGKKMTIFPHLWRLIPRCLCMQSVLFIANTQAVYFFSVGLLPTISVWFTDIYITMCIYLQPYVIKVCMPNEIYPNSFSFFFFLVGWGGGGGGRRRWGPANYLVLPNIALNLFR